MNSPAKRLEVVYPIICAICPHGKVGINEQMLCLAHTPSLNIFRNGTASVPLETGFQFAFTHTGDAGKAGQRNVKHARRQRIALRSRLPSDACQGVQALCGHDSRRNSLHHLVCDRYALGYLIMGIVADLVAGAGHYKSKKINSLSYILLSLGGTGSYLVFFANPDGWAKTMLGNGTEQSYIDTMRQTGSVWILMIMLAGTVLAATFSAFVGCKMLRRQFEKAGITK